MVKQLITDFFSEAKGGGSAMRFVMIVIVLVIIATWAAMCAIKRVLLPFDGTHVTLMGTCFTAHLGGKYLEGKAPADPAPAPPQS